MPFDGDIDRAITYTSNWFEMMVWQYCPPTDSGSLEHYEAAQMKIDNFLILSTVREGCEPLGDLIHCYRGWNIHDNESSRTLVSIFRWMSQEDEIRFKDPHRSCKLVGATVSDNDLYETCFLEAADHMQVEGWLRWNKHVHFQLAKWVPLPL